MLDLLVIGGGVVGLSLAYEAAGRGLRVRVLDRGAPASEASWAGAGMLASARPHADNRPAERLSALSHALHGEWAERLREETGIDNGFRRCGGLYLELADEPDSALAHERDTWRRQGVPAREVEPGRLGELEPALATAGANLPLRAALELPEDAQVRNPWHLRALLAACARRGAIVSAGMPVDDFALSPDGRRIAGAIAGAETLTAGAYCLTSGCWTGTLARRAGCELPIEPVRGQIVLLHAHEPPLQRIINVGRRYLVPRRDGRLLIGATEEHAGFDQRPTAAGVGGLLAFAQRLAPALGAAPVERTWAGLRPGTADGLPYLGRLGELRNAYVAAGHFRNGLFWSPATAQAICEAICGETPSLDLAPYRVGRPISG